MNLLFLLFVFFFVVMIASVGNKYESGRINRLRSMEQCPPHKWESIPQPGAAIHYLQCSKCKRFPGENYGDEV